MPTTVTREDLNDVCAAFKGYYGVFQGRRPRHGGNAAAVTRFNHNYIEAGDAKT
ncbi:MULTISPECIES: hypothetical protein [Megasphaera]|uniref:hypothetical protein n=1 Tax=Megasphaera TaxID=906 RepID=UPI001D00A322|nr:MULTISPECIES: hypothetical protein [Megasphaera]